MTTLLISFCNVFPYGLTLGLFDFDADAFNWIDTSAIDEDLRGVAGIYLWKHNYWLLPQYKKDWNLGVSKLVIMDSNFYISHV